MGETLSQDLASSNKSDKEWEARQKLANTPFAELTSEQKIDRLVEYVRSFEYIINRVVSLEGKVNQLERHSHNEQGLAMAVFENKNRTFNAAI